MGQPLFIPFGEWLPDLPAFGNPGLLVAKNCTPKASSYGPLRSLAPYATALDGRVIGAKACRSSTGQMFTFAATPTKLYRLGSGSPTFSDVTRSSGGDYAADEHVEFNQFGDYVTAWNGVDAAQVFQLGVSTNFAALSGSPPLARYACGAGDQVMVGRIASAPNRVQFCGLDSLTTWGTSAALQADYQDLAGDAGDVMALVGRLSPHIWCQHSIYLATYQGPPVVWKFDRVETERGTLFPRSVVGYGTLSFGIGEDNFYVFNGTSARPISQDKVAKWFYADVDQGYPDRVYGAVDPVAQCVVWAYPGQGHGDGNPNRLILYHWPSGRWAYADMTLEFLASAGQTFGFTLEDLDSISGSIDALPASLDSRIWTSTGSTILSAFTTAHRLAYFTGDTLEARFEKGDLELIAGRKSCVQAIWPKVEGTGLAPTMTPLTRDRQDAAYTEHAVKAVNTLGFAPVRKTARFHKPRLIVPAASTWTHATGFDVEVAPSGQR